MSVPHTDDVVELASGVSREYVLESAPGASRVMPSFAPADATAVEMKGKKGGKGADRENAHRRKKQSTGKSGRDRHTRRHGQRNPPINPNKRRPNDTDQ